MTAMRTIELAGAAMELSASSSEGRIHLDWFFGPSPASASDPELRVAVDDALRIGRPLGTPTMEDGPILRWDEGDQLRLWHEAGAGAVVNDSSLTIGGGAGGHRWRVTRQLLFSALSWWYARGGGVMLHAAMVGRHGEAVVITGFTGRGKSTLALAAYLRGWDLCADDLVVVTTEPTPPEVSGLPKRPTVSAELAGALSVPTEPIPGDDRGRLMLPPSVLTVGPHTVRAIVAVDHDDGVGTTTRLTHTDALAALVSSSIESPQPDALRRQLHSMAALAGLPAFRLAHAADLGDRLTRAADLLEEVWTRSA